MSFKVRIKGNKEFYEKELRKIEDLSNKQLDEISLETEKALKNNVASSIQRPGSTGNLESQMYREKTLNGWGIGNIENLNRNAPQWKWLDVGVAGTGRKIPPGTNENPNIRGSFSPNQSKPSSGEFRQGRFQKGGGFPMNPTRPIEPHNFVAKTVAQIQSIVNSVLKRIK